MSTDEVAWPQLTAQGDCILGGGLVAQGHGRTATLTFVIVPQFPF